MEDFKSDLQLNKTKISWIGSDEKAYLWKERGEQLPDETCYGSVHLFHLLSTFHFYFLSTPVSPLRLAFYIHSSFTLLEAAHLTQSSCSTMMIPSCFLPLYSINTRDIVDCNLTYSWEYLLLFPSSLSNLTSWQQLYLSSLIQTRLLTVETSTVS